MYVTACAHVYVCMCVSVCGCASTVYIIPSRSRLTLRLWLFTPLSLPSPHPSVFPLLHFSLYHSIYSWISCLSWKLMHENRGWEGGKNKNNTKKTKQGECWWGFCLVWVHCCIGSPVLGGHMQEDPDSISLFISFLFCLFFHPPTYRLASLLPNIRPPLLILPPPTRCLYLLLFFVSPSQCQSQLQAEELSFLNNSQVD